MVIHFGTNDLRREKEPDEGTKQIVDFGISAKKAKNEVAISGFVPRKDRYSKRAKMTNESLT